MIAVRLQTVKTKGVIYGSVMHFFGHIYHKEYRLYYAVASHIKYEET